MIQKIMIAILVLFAFSWLVGCEDYVVSASDLTSTESPESLVTCAAGNGDIISNGSVPETINVEQCRPFEDVCAPCIISLEDQGCEIVDVVVTQFPEFKIMTTYLLSCDGR